MSDDMAQIVPLRGEDNEPEVSVRWTPAEELDPGAYRRLLEHLFLPRPADQVKAA